MIPAFQPPRETFRCLGAETFAAIELQWLADDEGIGAPFLNQSLQLCPVGLTLFRRERCQCAGRARDPLADGNADSFFAMVEAEEGVRRCRIRHARHRRITG